MLAKIEVCWANNLCLACAEESSAQIQQALREAANLGYSGQDLLLAAVDSLSKAIEGAAPSNESPAAKRLRLLVSPCQSGCPERLAWFYCMLCQSSQCMHWRLHALTVDIPFALKTSIEVSFANVWMLVLSALLNAYAALF